MSAVTKGRGGDLWTSRLGVGTVSIAKGDPLAFLTPSTTVIGSTPPAAGLNPFYFRYQLQRPATVRLDIKDMNNNIIRTLVDNEPRSSGLTNQEAWDGKNGSGTWVSSGTYRADITITDPYVCMSNNKFTHDASFSVNLFRIVDVVPTSIIGLSTQADISYQLSQSMWTDIKIYKQNVEINPNDWKWDSGVYAEPSNILYSISGMRPGRYRVTEYWDGRDSNGYMVEDGRYPFTIVAHSTGTQTIYATDKAYGYIDVSRTNITVISGDFNSSTGAVFGQIGYEDAIDIKYVNNDVYVLARNYPNTYIIKYSDNGTLLSPRKVGNTYLSPMIVSDKGEDSFRFLVTTGTFIYAAGNKNGIGSPSTIVSKYDMDLNFISSSTFSNSDLRSLAVAGDYLYGCVQNPNAAIVKIDSNLSLSDSLTFTTLPPPSYFCGDIIATDKLYVFLTDDYGNNYISTSMLNDIHNHTITQLEDLGTGIFKFAANSSNIFAIALSSPTVSIYKYGLDNFDSFVSSSSISSLPSLYTFSVTDGFIAFGYNPYNPATNNFNYSVLTISTDTFKVFNRYTIDTGSNDYIRKMDSTYNISGSSVYVTGDTYYCKSFGCDNDIRTLKLTNVNATENRAPILTFPQNFENGINDKVIALSEGTTFYVEYNDLDGDTTSEIKVIIDSISYDMKLEGDWNYSSDGVSALFSYFLPSGSLESSVPQHYYKFSAKDTKGKEAVGLPVSYPNQLIVVKGFSGSLDQGKIDMELPSEEFDKRLIINGSTIAIIATNDDRGGFFARLSTATDMSSSLMPRDIYIYDAISGNNGNFEVVASSRTYDDKHQIFSATMDSNFNIIESSVVFETADDEELPQTLRLYSKGDTKYAFNVEEDEFSIIKHNNEQNIFSSEIKINGNPTQFIKGFVDDYIYAVGYYVKTDSSTDGFIARISDDLSSQSIVTFNSPGAVSYDKFTDILKLGDDFYISGYSNNGSDNYGFVLVYDSETLELVDSKLFNLGKNENIKNILLTADGKYLIVGGDMQKVSSSISNSVPFFIKLDTVTLDITSTFIYTEDKSNNIIYQSAINDVDSIYFVSDIKQLSGIASTSNGKIEKKKINDILRDNTSTVNMVVTSTSNAPLSNAYVSFIPSETGTVDIGKIKFAGMTDSSGKITSRVLNNVPYIISISTSRFSPTVNQQVADPYQRFLKAFNSDTTLNYSFSSINTSTYTFRAVVNNVKPGYPLSISLITLGTNETISLNFAKATDTLVTVDIYNVPKLSTGKYKIDVSIPGILSKTDIVYSEFPSTCAATADYYMDFSSAVVSGGSYNDQTKQSIAILSGIVVDTLYNPVSNARVEISTGNFDSVQYTDVNGKFSFYNSTSDIGYNNLQLNITKKGYIDIWNTAYIPSSYNMTYVLMPATYTISGYITYNGIPLSGVKVQAGGYDSNNFNFTGDDSYAPSGNYTMSWINSYSVTDSSGYFKIDGLKDGNVGLYTMDPMYKNINFGADNEYRTDDDIRIVISSSGAKSPSYPPNNPCTAGRVWVLDKSGACKGISPYTFDFANPITEDANLTLNVSYDEVGATDTDATILISEDSYDGVGVQRLVKLPAGLISGTTSYNIKLTGGKRYWCDVISDKWARRSALGDIDFTQGNTSTASLMLTRAGKLKISVVKPDGSVFMPKCNYEGCEPPKVYINSYDKSYDRDTNFIFNQNDDPILELSVPNGLYNLSLETDGYPVSSVENVSVVVGKTTDVRIKMQDGVVVQPAITSLPDTMYYYIILSMPSGFEMKGKNITDILFGKDSSAKYIIDYDTATSYFEPKYLTQGKYDFYLALGSSFNPESHDNSPISFRSFVNFIGKEKNKVIQKDSSNPLFGTSAQPVSDFSLYGSIGKSSLTGRITGKNILTQKDFDTLFQTNSLDKLISLIPYVMLYDASGELRGLSHSLMDDGESYQSFMSGVVSKSSQTIYDIFIDSSSYYIPNLPNGSYTAVFLSPNYPAVTKEITVNGNTVFDFDFDSAGISISKLSGTITDNNSNPLSGVAVYITHKTFEKTVYSDNNGRYSFDNLPPGLYRMSLSKDGYVSDGKKFSVNQSEDITFDFKLNKSASSIIGKVYISKFPNTFVTSGVSVVAYDETKSTSGVSYVPKIETLTGDDGSYEIKGVEANHTYRIVATYPGKMTQSILVKALSSGSVADDMVFVDIPPQINVKLRRDKSSLEVNIKSPKELLTVPVCEYVAGKYDSSSFDNNNSVQLALVKSPGNTYIGRFNVSKLVPYYTLRITAGDVDKIEKIINYDVKNDIASENYISDEIYIGGNIYMDSDNEEYSGIELDPGAFTKSTATSSANISSKVKVMSVGGGELIGGFFSALPSIRNVKTPKGEMSLSDAISNVMASDVYDLDISNAEPNRAFTLTLKYDKERVIQDTNNLKIYQYNEESGQWVEVSGTYTVDPMLGTVSVDVVSLSKAYEKNPDTTTPFGRKKLGMSAMAKDGGFVPQSSSSPQTGRFAVFVSKPPTGTVYTGSGFEIYNIPNPFNLKSKVVSISSDGGSWTTGNYTTYGTVIKYHLPAGKKGNVKLVIYNTAGEKVRTLEEGIRDGGYVYYSEWDGRNDKNEKCASGVYFLIAYINGDKIGGVHKMAIVK
ncbi:MAG: carboxypeptidase regulatory-like domain-containing protein [Elusimicrobiales bacterium]|nr:carboxypeptidase regulatory-like domain-containing protein [Elusimicrobiales bacterium]